MMLIVTQKRSKLMKGGIRWGEVIMIRKIRAICM